MVWLDVCLRMLVLVKCTLDDAHSVFLLLLLEVDFVDTLIACDGDRCR